MNPILIFLAGAIAGAAALATAWRLRTTARDTPPDAPGTDPCDTHLCLNALGRIAIPLVDDEPALDGIEHLSDHLAACRGLDRALTETALRQACDCHWRLRCWTHGVTPGPLQWQVPLGQLAPAEQRVLAQRLRALLAELPLDAAGQATLAIHCTLGPAVGGLRNLRCRVVLGEGEARLERGADWPIRG
jgi:hypothetical protein